jgi:DNA-binding NarL/FixJ family response regulator
MEIIGEFPDPLELLLAAKETAADAIIVELNDSKKLGLCSHLLSECPKVRILGLASEGNNSFIEQLCSWCREIIDLSMEDIL